MRRLVLASALLAALPLVAACKGRPEDDGSPSAARQPAEILNVSYDPTRELYQELNPVFERQWRAKTGAALTVRQSHGGSGKQARAVIDGLEADVVTLALAWDIDAISQRTNLLPAGWQSRLPNRSCPYTSTIVFVVRKGNPKGIHDWPDLARPGVSVITPNPKTSGGARWNYLAAWGSELLKALGDPSKIRDPRYAGEVAAANVRARNLMAGIFANVPVLDSGARGSTNTFAQREIGDVLLAWENEAWLSVNEIGRRKLEIVVPPASILAEPPVAWLDGNNAGHGTAAAARAYLEFLYSEPAQEIIARHHYRPANAAVAARHKGEFADLRLFTIDEMFGGWAEAQKTHFDGGGTFDQIYAAKEAR